MTTLPGGARGVVSERRLAVPARDDALERLRPGGRPGWHLVNFEATVDNLSAAVVVADLAGRLLYANRQAEEIFGWVAEDMVGSSLAELSEVEVEASTADEISETLHARGSWSGEFEVGRADGSRITVSVSNSGLYDSDGSLVGVVSVVNDVTEIRESVHRLISETQALRFLLEATTIVSSAAGFEECVRSLGSLAVPLLGDICFVDVVADGVIQRMVATHADPDKALLTERLLAYPPKFLGPHPSAVVMRTGEAAIAGAIDDARLRETTIDDEHFQLLKDLEVHSFMCIPLKTQEHVLGALTLVSAGSGRTFGPQNLALAGDLADRVARVIDRARLHSEQSRIARSLQAALLPRALPRIPGFQIAAEYQAAGEGNDVGGDFYDVFEIGRGAWVVAIGDVSGRGPDAAAVTGLVRHALHASARQSRDPKRMLAVANAMLCDDQDHSIERFCTAACGILRPGTPTRVTYASAGHPPPIVVRADGRIEELRTQGGVALGIASEYEGHSQRLAMNNGDLMVLYTDGLTEARSSDGSFYGEDRLKDLLNASVGATAEELVATLLNDVHRHTGVRLVDDLGLLVIGPVATP